MIDKRGEISYSNSGGAIMNLNEGLNTTPCRLNLAASATVLK